MKAYILKDNDFEQLLLKLDRDPAHGLDGGSSNSINPETKRIYDEVHRFYNYQIRTWIDDVKK